MCKTDDDVELNLQLMDQCGVQHWTLREAESIV